MPIVLRHNSDLEVSLVEYAGALTAAELQAHAQFNADNPVWLGFDCLSIACADVDIRHLSRGDLDAVFHGYHTLFQPLNLVIMRRSGWICEAPAARPLLQHWISKRNDNPYMWSEVRLFDAYDTAAAWLHLDRLGAEALTSGQDFHEVARFEIAAPAPALTR